MPCFRCPGLISRRSKFPKAFDRRIFLVSLDPLGFFIGKSIGKHRKHFQFLKDFSLTFFTPSRSHFRAFFGNEGKIWRIPTQKHIFGWGIEWNPSILLGVTQVGQILWHHEHPWCNTISSNDVRVDDATSWQPAGGFESNHMHNASQELCCLGWGNHAVKSSHG